MITASEILKNQEKKVADLESELANERIRLDGMRLMAQELGGENDQSSYEAAAPKRRMRLGSKKRVVYKLVASGYETVASLTRFLSKSDIDARYIREVVRVALDDEDMLGSVDDKFIMSEFGKELLEKASPPKDWEDFSYLTRQYPADSIPEKPQKQTPATPVPASTGVHQFTEDVAASSIEDEVAF